MPASAEFLDLLKDQMTGFGPVSVRRMFGGAGLFREQRMFALVVDDALYLKADGDSAAMFDAENLFAFAYGTKRGTKTIMSYRRAPARCLDDAEEMTHWCRIAWDAALRADRPRRG